MCRKAISEIGLITVLFKIQQLEIFFIQFKQNFFRSHEFLILGEIEVDVHLDKAVSLSGILTKFSDTTIKGITGI